MDRRDETTWVAIELTPHGETMVEDGTIEPYLRRLLAVDEDFPLFVPAATFRKRDRVVTVHLLQGYVFAASGLPETTYFEMEKQHGVAQVLSTNPGQHKIRRLSVLPESRIVEMREKLRAMISAEIRLGSTVTITEGVYRHLDGIVTGLEEDVAFVKIDLRSLKAVVTIPRLFLDTVDPV